MFFPDEDKIVWDPGDPHDDISVVILAGDVLCSGTMMTETLKQTQAVMRGGEEVENKVVGLASAKLRT